MPPDLAPDDARRAAEVAMKTMAAAADRAQAAADKFVRAAADLPPFPHTVRGMEALADAAHEAQLAALRAALAFRQARAAGRSLAYFARAAAAPAPSSNSATPDR